MTVRPEERVQRHRIEVRPDRLVVEYDVDPRQVREIWDHAAGLRDEGWRLLSIDSHVKAYRLGWFRSAGEPDELHVTVLYERVEPLGPAVVTDDGHQPGSDAAAGDGS